MPPQTFSANASFLLRFHEFNRLIGILGIHESKHHRAELFEIDRLRDVTVEAGVHTLRVYVPKYVGGESNNWQVRVLVLLFPLAKLAAGLVTVLVRHMEIALQQSQYTWAYSTRHRDAHQNDRVIAMRLGVDLFRALDAIKDSLDLN